MFDKENLSSVLSDGLNPRQEEAVNCLEGPLLIMAGFNLQNCKFAPSRRAGEKYFGDNFHQQSGERNERTRRKNDRRIGAIRLDKHVPFSLCANFAPGNRDNRRLPEKLCHL